jgi:hypothetical protein
MDKALLGIFVSGIIMVLVGVFLASQGLSSSETGSIVSGNSVANSLNESADSPEVAQAIADSKNKFINFGAVVFAIGFLELIVLGVMLVRGK